MKEFDKNVLTLFEHFGSAGSHDIVYLFYEQMKKEEIILLYGDENDYDLNAITTDVKLLQFHGMWRNMTRKVLNSIEGNINLMINIREPISRSISERQHMIKVISHMNLEEKSLMWKNLCDNYYVKNILKRHSQSDEDYKISEKEYEHCISIIEKNYFFVFIVEYFLECTYLLAKHFNWEIDNIDYLKGGYNFSRLKKDVFDQKTIEQFEEDCKYDIKLYNYFKNKLLKEIDNLTDKEKEQLNKFKERNNELLRKQRLLNILGVPCSHMKERRPVTSKTIEYFNNKSKDFFKKLKIIIEKLENERTKSELLDLSDPSKQINKKLYGMPFADYIDREPIAEEKKYIFEKLQNNKQYVLFGASYFGKVVIDIIKEYNIINNFNIEIIYILDNDKKKEKTMLYDYKIYLPTEENLKNKDIIIASRHYQKIENQLIKIGASKDKIINLCGDYYKDTGRMGKVYWITGKSSDKIGRQLKLAFSTNPNLDVILLKEDELQEPKSILNNSEEIESAYRNAKLCKTIAEQNKIVIYTTTFMFDEVMKWNRDNIIDYFEVHLKRDDDTFVAKHSDMTIRNDGYYTDYEIMGLIIAESSHLYQKYKNELIDEK